MQEIIINIMNDFGYLGIALLIAFAIAVFYKKRIAKIENMNQNKQEELHKIDIKKID